MTLRSFAALLVAASCTDPRTSAIRAPLRAIIILRGNSGVTGATGANGPAGSVGAGPTGPAGHDGVMGLTGPDAIDGSRGAAGPIGMTGARGADPIDDAAARSFLLTDNFSTAASITSATASGTWRSDTSATISWNGAGSVTLNAGERIVTLATFPANVTVGLQASVTTGGLLDALVRCDPVAHSGYFIRADARTQYYDSIDRVSDVTAGYPRGWIEIGTHISASVFLPSVVHEFRAVARGSQFTAWTDGLATASANDTTYATAGALALFCEVGSCTIFHVQITSP